MQVFICCEITLRVSGVHRTHHQEYIKLYQKLQLQFYVLLMMGAKTPETCRVILR